MRLLALALAFTLGCSEGTTAPTPPSGRADAADVPPDARADAGRSDAEAPRSEDSEAPGEDARAPDAEPDASTPDASAPDAELARADAASEDASTTTVAACPVDDLLTLYPGALPPNPFSDFPDASACVAAEHDVIILLGCPSNDDGTLSRCQSRRVELGLGFMRAGYGHRFITTGAAVHNAYVEADALADALLAQGVPASDVRREPLAEHTDENLYHSSRIMQAEGWSSALVVSESPGHLVMTAVCDADCCVNLGRLTVLELALLPDAGGNVERPKVGHYVLYPFTPAVTPAECAQIEQPLKAMCTNRSQRRACADDFRL